MSWLKRKLHLVSTILASAGLAAAFLFWGSTADAVDQFSGVHDAVPKVESTPAAAVSNTLTSNVGTTLMATNGPASTAEPSLPADKPSPAVTPSVPDHAGNLNRARQFALGMIETGNDDEAIGGLGEISRFQIMPSVWKQYTASRSYWNPEVATEVARQHWVSLYDYFKKKTGREPTDTDMYVLWNTRYGYYARKGFAPSQLHPIIRDRAERFANLVEDGHRRESLLAMATTR